MDWPAASKQLQGAVARSERREERIEAVLPVMLKAGGSGTTRDISASGVFFRTQTSVGEGDSIEFTIEFDDAREERSWTLACRGEVVRIECGDGSVGVAARIVDSKLAFKGRAGQRPEELV